MTPTELALRNVKAAEALILAAAHLVYLPIEIGRAHGRVSDVIEVLDLQTNYEKLADAEAGKRDTNAGAAKVETE